jgi:CRISPR-associated protein Cas1
VRVTDLQLLPRFADGLTFLYAEHVRVEQEQHAIVLVDAGGRIPVPVAALAVLMLGPGTSMTHAAVVACADNGCSVVFCGEGGVRLYASGLGETRRAGNLMDQARAWANPREHMRVVLHMYKMRFAECLDENLTLEQIRGMEGVRVRDTYARLSRETGVRWSGRAYQPNAWDGADPVNRALSTANACLYGLCHAALVSTGFSPGLGFVHTGKSLAFVYDIADLYKCEVTLPIAFRCAASGPLTGLEGRVRRQCRDEFRRARLLERIVPDVQRVLGLRADTVNLFDMTEDRQFVSDLWGPNGLVAGGQNYGARAADMDEDRRHVVFDEEDYDGEDS